MKKTSSTFMVCCVIAVGMLLAVWYGDKVRVVTGWRALAATAVIFVWLAVAYAVTHIKKPTTEK